MNVSHPQEVEPSRSRLKVMQGHAYMRPVAARAQTCLTRLVGTVLYVPRDAEPHAAVCMEERGGHQPDQGSQASRERSVMP